MLCWKGKYIVGITNVPAEQHFNVRYEYDNGAVIAHDFSANDPYPGVLTIEASESSDPTPVADFETELRAFLGTVGVGNVALSRVAQLDWWNTNAAFYAVPVYHIVNTQDDSNEDCLTLADQFGNIVVPVFSIGGIVGGHFYAQDGRKGTFNMPDGAACPVPDSRIANELSTEDFPVDVTTANYSVVKGNCNVDGQVAINLVPQDNAYPVIQGLGQFISGETDQLLILFSTGNIIVLQQGELPSIEEMAQGEKHYFMLDDSPFCLQQTGQQDMNIEILGSDSTHIKGYPWMSRDGNYYYSEDEYETTAAEVGYEDWIEILDMYQCEIHFIYNDDPSLEKATGVFEI